MHRIELVTETQPMFHIPGKLHLTWETPGPIDVDLSTFTEQEKNWLRNGKLKNVLKITNLNPEAKEEVTQQTASASTRTATPKKTSAQLAESIKVTAEENRKARETSAKKTLSAPLPALDRFVEKCEDLLQLRSMREEEGTNKKRVKVLKLLDDRISAVSGKVNSLVGEPLNDSHIAREANLPEIEEELEGPISIKVGAED